MVKIGRQKSRPNTLVSPAPVGWRTLAEKVYCGGGGGGLAYSLQRLYQCLHQYQVRHCNCPCHGAGATLHNTQCHNSLLFERPEPRCTSMSAALDVGHSRLDTFLRCYQGCLLSCSLRCSTIPLSGHQLSGTAKAVHETNTMFTVAHVFYSRRPKEDNPVAR